MLPQPLQNASDFNRGLILPLRLAHMVLAPIRALWAWANRPERRDWAAPLLLVPVLFMILHPFDETVLGWARDRAPIGGDIRRAMETLQQFGDLVVAGVVAIVIWILDPARRRRLLDLVAVYAVLGPTVWVLKVLIGRPRPKFDEPDVFLGPTGAYPLGAGEGVAYPWEFWAGISSELWSMPSSHTAHAVGLGFFLTALYPRLVGLMTVLVGIVACSRVVLGAHWPSDVAVGLLLGLAAARLCVNRYWGCRFIDWFWKRHWDPSAVPATPSVREHEALAYAQQGYRPRSEG